MSESQEIRPSLPPMFHNPLGWALFTILILAFPTWMLLQKSDPKLTEPPVFSSPSAYPLVNQNGEAIDLSRVRGEIIVVSFLFTRCPDICPALATRFIDLADRTPEEIDGVPVRFLSITVDPEYDQPGVLLKYRDQFGEDLDRWELWTGETEAIDATVAEFQQALERQSTGDVPTIVHSNRFVVLDPLGRIRNFYPSDDVGLAALEADLPIIAASF